MTQKINKRKKEQKKLIIKMQTLTLMIRYVTVNNKPFFCVIV